MARTRIQAAKWVSKDVEEEANRLYKNLVETWQKETDARKRIVIERHFNAIEYLVHNPTLKSLWKKFPSGGLLMNVDSIFRTDRALRPQTRKSATERKLRSCLDAMQKIINLMGQDYQTGFQLSCAYWQICPNDPLYTDLTKFFETFIKKVKSNSSAMSSFYPVHIKTERNVDKYYFSNAVSYFVEHLLFKKENTEVAATILKVIRPDLVPFNIGTIGKTYGRWKKTNLR
jgi:hypothetical protein